MVRDPSTSVRMTTYASSVILSEVETSPNAKRFPPLSVMLSEVETSHSLVRNEEFFRFTFPFDIQPRMPLYVPSPWAWTCVGGEGENSENRFRRCRSRFERERCAV